MRWRVHVSMQHMVLATGASAGLSVYVWALVKIVPDELASRSDLGERQWVGLYGWLWVWEHLGVSRGEWAQQRVATGSWTVLASSVCVCDGISQQLEQGCGFWDSYIQVLATGKPGLHGPAIVHTVCLSPAAGEIHLLHVCIYIYIYTYILTSRPPSCLRRREQDEGTGAVCLYECSVCLWSVWPAVCVCTCVHLSVCLLEMYPQLRYWLDMGT